MCTNPVGCRGASASSSSPSVSVFHLLGSVHEVQLPVTVRRDGHGRLQLLPLQHCSFGLHEQPAAGGK